ncbi:hypothetical protein EYF80_016292 [Liparis tanakae]|uniref:Uncharacterized protein n=1 Tax=Liparis tanakae TaxID=230148 RepID=A0A4Z2I846_9TELE|nr:hypothetical protein EYF80_016292 [Liparis tanakae]
MRHYCSREKPHPQRISVGTRGEITAKWAADTDSCEVAVDSELPLLGGSQEAEALADPGTQHAEILTLLTESLSKTSVGRCQASVRMLECDVPVIKPFD